MKIFLVYQRTIEAPIAVSLSIGNGGRAYVLKSQKRAFLSTVFKNCNYQSDDPFKDNSYWSQSQSQSQGLMYLPFYKNTGDEHKLINKVIFRMIFSKILRMIFRIILSIIFEYISVSIFFLFASMRPIGLNS